MKSRYLSFLFILMSLAFFSCDNFSKDSGALAKELDDLIVWNNAKDLNVTVLVESRDQGQIVYESEKKKQGYAFQLKFLMDKNYPGSFDHWAAFEEYTPGRTDNEINDFSIIEFKEVADSSYKVVDVIVKDGSKKYTIVPLCSENPIVKTQVEQKYKGQVSITGPSNVELGVPYDVKLETNALYGFNEWEFYTKDAQGQKITAKIYESSNITVTAEEQELTAYKEADAAIFRVIKTVEQGYTTVSMKFVLLKDKRTDFYIEGKLYDLPTVFVSNENLSSIKIGTAQSKVQSISVKATPEKLSGNEVLYDFEAKAAAGLGIVTTGAFSLTDSDGQNITPVLITSDYISDTMRTTDDFKNAKVVITEQLLDGDGVLTGKILLRDCLDVNIKINTYALPRLWVSNSVEGVTTEPAGEQVLKVNQSIDLIVTEKSGYEFMGFVVKDSEGTEINDYSSFLKIEKVSGSSLKYRITVLGSGTTGYYIVPKVVPRQSVLSYTPSDNNIAQSDSIVIDFSQEFATDAASIAANNAKVEVRVNDVVDSNVYFYVPAYNGCEMKIQNKKKLNAGTKVKIVLKAGIKASNESQLKQDKTISFTVSAVSDNTPPEIKNPVLYYHSVPSVNSYKARNDKCGKTVPEEFSVDKIDVSDINNSSDHIKNVNVYKESFGGQNTVDNKTIQGLEDDHFVVSFSADDTSTGGSDIQSVSLTEKVIYLPENMVIPQNISSIKNSNYQKVPAGGYYVEDLINSRYFSGSSQNIKDFFECSYTVPFTSSPKVDVSYPFSSKLNIGGIHEFTVTIKDSACATNTETKFYVNFSGERKIVNTSSTRSNGKYKYNWYSYGGTTPYNTVEHEATISYTVNTTEFMVVNRYLSAADEASNSQEYFLFGFSFDNLYELYKDPDKPHMMVVEPSSDKYDLVNRNSSFTGQSYFPHYFDMVGNDPEYISSAFYYKNEKFPDFPEDAHIVSYNPSYMYYNYQRRFSCAYRPRFMNEKGLFSYDVYTVDSYGTPTLLKNGISIKSNKYCPGDVVFWNKNVNSIFVKSYSELATLDTAAVPFAVIAYVDDDFIYGISLETSVSYLCWAEKEENSKYNVYTDSMGKEYNSLECKRIQDEIITEIGGDLTKFPVLNYVKNYGSSKLGFNAGSSNTRIKKLATEWVLPTYILYKRIRTGAYQDVNRSCEIFDSRYPKASNIWLLTYGRYQGQGAVGDDADKTKMAYFWDGYGEAQMCDRDSKQNICPFFDFTDILQ